eukprot:CAMPEP_0168500712 /NCGR_PEP_ID=MMETSP0228-20121227/74430_1 /TAXON_ID=133427 /ORGANISM="Protoceratium reticulatum, Strain CCCM 535 (=CCMP 1889)" /LENGTH=57 /DNA_ID=CAMNT_0008517643 /DNA_START=12 /DNA_END=181 /DNA_ORIENTATION=+
MSRRGHAQQSFDEHLEVPGLDAAPGPQVRLQLLPGPLNTASAEEGPELGRLERPYGG